MAAFRATFMLFKLARQSQCVRGTDLWSGFAADAAGLGLAVGAPWFLKLLLDRMSQSGPIGAEVVWLIGGFVLTMALGPAIAAWRLRNSKRVVNALARTITLQTLSGLVTSAEAGEGKAAQSTFGALERLPFSLQVLMDGIVWQAFPLILQVALSLAILAGQVSAVYIAILLLTLIAYGIATVMGSTHHNTTAAASNQACGAASALLGDLMGNLRRAVLNGAVPFELDRIDAVLAARGLADDKLMRSLGILGGLQALTISLGLGAGLVLAARDVLDGRMSATEFILLQAYAFRLILPLSGFGYSLSQVSFATANIEAVMEVLPAQPISRSLPVPGSKTAHMQLNDVSFTYGAGLSGVDRITLEIVAGAFIAIVGRNGSGKSTLAQLMAGVLSAQTGQVLVNGRNIQETDVSLRHCQVLYVPQLVRLFDRTLGENALYAQSRHSEETVAALLDVWRFYDDGRQIDLSVPAGGAGQRLSGGQVQKLELARVTGINAPIVILDETTSALDAASEGQIMGDLRRLLGCNVTIIVVTHKLALAEAADEVVFMQQGRVVASGSHDALQRCHEAYRQLWPSH